MDNWNLIGHTWAVRLLQGHLRRDNLRHAYLFTGPQGTGRRTLALRLAQAINCPTPAAPGIPCGVCRTCRLTEAMQHPDLLIAQAEREGGTLKVEQIRALQRGLSLAPYEARRKIALLLRFEEAHPSAANALLKTLEEPPPNVIVLMTASDAEALLPTIPSRCEVLRLRPLPVDTVAQGLTTLRGIPAKEAALLAHLSEGRPGLALRLHTDPSLLETRRQALELLLTLLPAPRVERFAAAERLAKDRSALKHTLRTWLSFWRDVLHHTSGANLPLINADYAEHIRSLAAGVSFETAGKCTQTLFTTLERLEKNVNPRLATEVCLLEMPRLPAALTGV